MPQSFSRQSALFEAVAEASAAVLGAGVSSAQGAVAPQLGPVVHAGVAPAGSWKRGASCQCT